MSATPHQDMAPAGGFPTTMRYQRYLPTRGPSGAVVLITVLGMMSYGWYRLGQANAEFRELRREKAWGRIHLAPLLQAETDRDLVRRLEAVKRREAAIMDSDPDWSPLDLKAPVKGIGRWGVADPNQAEPVYYTERYVAPFYVFLPNDDSSSTFSLLRPQSWRGSNMLSSNPKYHDRSDFTKEHPIGE